MYILGNWELFSQRSGTPSYPANAPAGVNFITRLESVCKGVYARFNMSSPTIIGAMDKLVRNLSWLLHHYRGKLAKEVEMSMSHDGSMFML